MEIWQKSKSKIKGEKKIFLNEKYKKFELNYDYKFMCEFMLKID